MYSFYFNITSKKHQALTIPVTTMHSSAPMFKINDRTKTTNCRVYAPPPSPQDKQIGLVVSSQEF